MKLDDYKKLVKKPKKPKYNNTKVNGYDSAKEYRRSEDLKLQEKAGFISDLGEQVPYLLAPPQFVESNEGKQVCVRRSLKYVADFVYIKNGKTIVEDVKGFKTLQYKHKKLLMKQLYGIEILET